MGFEYRLHAVTGTLSNSELEPLRKMPTFWKKNEQYGSYFLGRIESSEWPAVIIWARQGDIDVTFTGSSDSTAWGDVLSFVLNLMQKHPDLRITEWDDDSEHLGHLRNGGPLGVTVNS